MRTRKLKGNGNGFFADTEGGRMIEQLIGEAIGFEDAKGNDLSEKAKIQEKKTELLKKYAEKPVTAFWQYDGFNQPLGHDHEIYRVDTFELMRGTDVRVLVPKETEVPRAAQVAMLRKIADWLEREEPADLGDTPF